MNPEKHKEQRVGVFVDVQNMYYSAKNLYSAKVNFKKVLDEGVAGRKLVRAFAYVIKADVGAEQDFFDALSNIGFEVRTKELQIFYGGAKKGDWDVGLCMDVVRMIQKLDAVVLVSGDGDYKDLLDYARSQGVRTEVIAFGKTGSSRLVDVADEFMDMCKSPGKFLIGRKSSKGSSKKNSNPSNNTKSENNNSTENAKEGEQHGESPKNP